MARGIKIDDIEKVTRSVFNSLLKDFTKDGGLRMDAGDLNISVGLIKNSVDNSGPGRAMITIYDNASDHLKVNHRFSVVQGSSATYSLHYLVNNPDAFWDKVFSNWRNVRQLQETACNSMSNYVEIQPFPYLPKGYEISNSIVRILDESKVNLNKVVMSGLPDDFAGFYYTYIQNRTSSNTNSVIPSIGSMNSRKEDEEYCSWVFNRLIEKKGLDFSGSNLFNVEDFLKKDTHRKYVNDEMVENIYLEMLKNKKNNSMSLYNSLSTLVNPEKIKSKEFKAFKELRGAGEDSMIVEALPEGFDTFFLSKTFVDKMFSFSTDLSSGNKKIMYSEDEQKENVQFFFKLLATQGMQSSSSVLDSSVSSVKGVMQCTLDVNSKYSREKLQEFSVELLGKLNEMFDANPLPGKKLSDAFKPGKKSSGDYQYGAELKEWMSIRKLNNRLNNKMDKVLKETSCPEVEDTSNTSQFKI